MRTFRQKAIGAALTSVLALSGVPSAFALSLNADVHALTNVHRDDVSVQSDASASAHADADATAAARCRAYSGDDLARCEAIIRERADAKGEVKADIETHGNFVSTVRHDEQEVKTTVAGVEARVVAMLKRVVNTGARLLRHACKAENPDEAVIKQCMAAAKSHIQAEVTAMIDAAFSVN